MSEYNALAISEWRCEEGRWIFGSGASWRSIGWEFKFWDYQPTEVFEALVMGENNREHRVRRKVGLGPSLEEFQTIKAT